MPPPPPQPPPPHLPVVLLLDLDHTVVGRTSAQWAQVCVHDAATKLHAIGALRLDAPPPEPDLAPAMRAGVMRPGFADFVTGVRALHPTTEIFIYTNAHKAWATRKVRAVERASGVRFRRPILCGDPWSLDAAVPGTGKTMRVKSMRLAFPTVVRALLRDYPALSHARAQEAVFRERLLFVDDTPRNLVDAAAADRAMQLVVPAYSRAVHESPDAQLPAAARRHPHIRALVSQMQSLEDETGADDRMWAQLLHAVRVIAPAPPTAATLRRHLRFQ